MKISRIISVLFVLIVFSPFAFSEEITTSPMTESSAMHDRFCCQWQVLYGKCQFNKVSKRLHCLNGKPARSSCKEIYGHSDECGNPLPFPEGNCGSEGMKEGSDCKVTEFQSVTANAYCDGWEGGKGTMKCIPFGSDTVVEETF